MNNGGQKMDAINYECLFCRDDCHVECDCLVNANKEKLIIEYLNRIIDFLTINTLTTKNEDDDYIFILNTLINRARHLINDLQTPYSKIKADNIMLHIPTCPISQ
jgi:hypothetical protein